MVINGGGVRRCFFMSFVKFGIRDGNILLVVAERDGGDIALFLVEFHLFSQHCGGIQIDLEGGVYLLHRLVGGFHQREDGAVGAAVVGDVEAVVFHQPVAVDGAEQQFAKPLNHLVLDRSFLIFEKSALLVQDDGVFFRRGVGPAEHTALFVGHVAL